MFGTLIAIIKARTKVVITGAGARGTQEAVPGQGKNNRLLPKETKKPANRYSPG
jgi:hypothetical protein